MALDAWFYHSLLQNPFKISTNNDFIRALLEVFSKNNGFFIPTSQTNLSNLSLFSALIALFTNENLFK